MAAPLLTDTLWATIEPLLPQHPKSPLGGRPRVSDRAALTGILFVLKSGIPWEYLPREMGCGSGMTCWRRLKEWQEAGVWQALHRLLLERLAHADRLDWSRACIDSASVPAKKGASLPAPIPPTVRVRAPNAIFSPTPRASRLRSNSRAPTATTAASSSP